MNFQGLIGCYRLIVVAIGLVRDKRVGHYSVIRFLNTITFFGNIYWTGTNRTII